MHPENTAWDLQMWVPLDEGASSDRKLRLRLEVAKGDFSCVDTPS